jgi:cell division septation protein DedD
VTTTAEIQNAAPESLAADSRGAFTVQIGAFKEPKNAARAQALAQERYKHQVFSDFNQRLGLYQIRIGIFASHAEAEEFLHQIRQDYPLDYRESWIASVQQ